MFEREESRHDFAFLAGVVIGALAGAAATLALTPMSGAETREKLRAQTSNVQLGDLKQRASDMAGAAGTRVAPLRERMTELASRTPLPVGRKEDSMESSHGAHPDEPAEGRPDAPGPQAGSSRETEARVSGEDNGLEDTPAQSVTPNIDDDERANGA